MKSCRSERVSCLQLKYWYCSCPAFSASACCHSAAGGPAAEPSPLSMLCSRVVSSSGSHCSPLPSPPTGPSRFALPHLPSPLPPAAGGSSARRGLRRAAVPSGAEGCCRTRRACQHGPTADQPRWCAVRGKPLLKVNVPRVNTAGTNREVAWKCQYARTAQANLQGENVYCHSC